MNESNDASIIRIQRNLIMMDFDIEMVNKIILYFNIESENQAIDYLTKNSEGKWGHPFIPRMNDDAEENSSNNSENTSILSNVKTRISSIRNEGISNAFKVQIDHQLNNQNEILCEICGEIEKEHISYNQQNNINNNEGLIEDTNTNTDNNSETLVINSEINNNNLNTDTNLEVRINNINNNNDNNNNIEIINSSNDQEKNCPICLCDIENKVELENCHHKFCYECFNEYLMNLINQNKIGNIPCPVKDCSNKNIKEEFFSQYLTGEQYFKFRTFRSQNEIARDPKKMFCPLCEGYAPIENRMDYKYDPNNPKYEKSTITCINGHNFCSCGIPLHDGDCYRDPNDFQKYLVSEHIKQCPKCGFYIKKNRGCNHMTCGNHLCKYEFCWICMKEAVPGHFEYGRCRGMQFIDTNSCMYKLKQKHPCIHCLIILFKCLIDFLITFAIILLFPSVVIMLVIIILLGMQPSFRQIFRDVFLANHSRHYKRLFFLTLFMILFSLQSVMHLAMALLIMFFLVIISLMILIKIIRTIYELFNYCRNLAN